MSHPLTAKLGVGALVYDSEHLNGILLEGEHAVKERRQRPQGQKVFEIISVALDLMELHVKRAQ